MPYDRHLADELRYALEGRSGLTERAMFGGLCWLLNGHMICGVTVGRYMFRVGKTQEPEALTRSGAEPVVLGGRRMGGFVWVDADAALELGLGEWIDLATGYVAALPPK